MAADGPPLSVNDIVPTGTASCATGMKNFSSPAHLFIGSAMMCYHLCVSVCAVRVWCALRGEGVKAMQASRQEGGCRGNLRLRAQKPGD